MHFGRAEKIIVGATIAVCALMVAGVSAFPQQPAKVDVARLEAALADEPAIGQVVTALPSLFRLRLAAPQERRERRDGLAEYLCLDLLQNGVITRDGAVVHIMDYDDPQLALGTALCPDPDKN